MQRFKDFERDLKTKAYSTSALAKDHDMDVEEVERLKNQEWLGSTIQVINDQLDEFDADLEILGNKKSLSADDKSQQASLKTCQERHRWHLNKLELILRALNNDSIDMTDLAVVRESIEVYLESHQDPDFYHDEALYDCFDLTEFEERTKARTPSMDMVAKESTGSS